MSDDDAERLEVSRADATAYRPRFRDNHPQAEPVGCFTAWWKSLWDDEDYYDDDESVVEGAMSIDLNKRRNRREHHTRHYETNKLVLRRGHAFSIDIKLSDVEFDSTLDTLELQFATGDNPKLKDDTLCTMKVCPNKQAIPHDELDSWYAFMTSQSRSEVHIDVMSPSDAIVGSYSLAMMLHADDRNMKKKRYVERCDESIYIIFNPWCSDDQVYMENEDERVEYVLRDTGRIYVGNVRDWSPKPWKFGQYDEVCLDAAFYLLDRSPLRTQGHGNAIQVCRTLTSQLNSKDNAGVLVGNWTGHYAGGVQPTAWNGSVPIIEQYMRTRQPVKYGQCWVFSGLMTTVCRALGIPCRSITTFRSGIDRDASMTIDQYVNENLRPRHDLDDGTWNFHVWNDVWLKRSDLPRGYDGWQAADSCPQDSMVSEGLHWCGPAPLKAIKEGNVYLGFDTGFLFSSVNGDQITWIIKRNGDVKPIKKFSKFNHIGKKISTKSVGGRLRHDITDEYKHSEGSDLERAAVQKAASFGSRKAKLLKFYDDDIKYDVTFTMDGKAHSNGDIELRLRLRNEAPKARTVALRMTATAAYYTGVTGEQIAGNKHEITLNTNDDKRLQWIVPAKLYLNAIDEDAMLKIWLTGKVKETGQVYFDTDIYDTKKPELTLELNKKQVRVGEEVEVTVKFTNPLDIKLLNGMLQLEGLGDSKNIRMPIHRGLATGHSLEQRVRMTPRFAGSTEIIASLNFRQLTGIYGAADIEIVE